MTWTATCELGTTPGIDPAGWIDVSSRLLDESFDMAYGRRDEFDQPDTSTCRLALDNYDGNWDEGIPPNTAVRLSVTDGTRTVDMFRGIVESAPSVWPLNGQDERVEVRAVGPEAVLSRDEVEVGPFAQQVSGTRIAALLDVAGWPAGMRDLDPGVVRIDPTEDVEAVNVLHALREVAEAEDGVLWVTPDGTMTFRGRHARLDLTSVATFDVGAGEKFAGLDPAYGDGPLWTAVRAEMAGGTVYTMDDPTAVGLYGDRVLLVRDMPVPWYEVNGLMSWRLLNYANPRRRIDQLVVGRENPDAPMLELGQRVTINHHRPSGSTASEDAVVEQVRRGATRDGIQSVYVLSPYFGEGPWLTLDDDTLGVLDGDNKWAP